MGARTYWGPGDAVLAQGSIIRCGKRGTTQGEDGKGLRSPSNSNTAWFRLADLLATFWSLNTRGDRN